MKSPKNFYTHFISFHSSQMESLENISSNSRKQYHKKIELQLQRGFFPIVYCWVEWAAPPPPSPPHFRRNIAGQLGFVPTFFVSYVNPIPTRKWGRLYPNQFLNLSAGSPPRHSCSTTRWSICAVCFSIKVNKWRSEKAQIKAKAFLAHNLLPRTLQ